MDVTKKYPQMTAEEYRNKLAEIFSRIQSESDLRYFYMFVSGKVELHSKSPYKE